MQLTLNEQSQDEVLKLFDKLDDLTREPFATAKREIDTSLSLKYGIDVDELRPGTTTTRSSRKVRRYSPSASTRLSPAPTF